MAGRGRPKLPEGERKDTLLQIRATGVEREELLRAAAADEETFSEWALAILLRAARRRRRTQ